MFADVFLQVTGQTCQSTPAELVGWRRYGLKGLSYPGAVQTDQANDRIQGVLWFDVSAAALAALDQFEGDQYRRVTTHAQTNDGKTFQVQIYEWLMTSELEGSWSPEVFNQRHRASFVQTHSQHQQEG